VCIVADPKSTSIVLQTLQQVRVGPYDVQFKFGSMHEIACQGDVTVWAGDEKVATWKEGIGWSDLAFQRLLYEPILTCSGASCAVIRIDFAASLALEIHRPYSISPANIYVD